MSDSQDKVHYNIRLRPTPDALRDLIPENFETEYALRFLEIEGRTPALDGLQKYLERDTKDVKKLIRNLCLQLRSEQVLTDRNKVQKGKRKRHKGIIEIKATRGHCRLFAFFSESSELIIATNTYWKTSGNKAPQEREFDRAAEMRNKYLNLS